MRTIETSDLTFLCDEGIFNVRVGALIIHENKLLAAGNKDTDYLYSVGGRIKFGERADDAIKREVYEELGINMEIDHLGIVHENFFYRDIKEERQLVHELSLYYYMKLNSDITQRFIDLIAEERYEFFRWIDSKCNLKIYPNFLLDMAMRTDKNLVHICTDDRTCRSN